jgi:hypothetical protein
MILLVETIISVYRTLKSELKRESYAQNKIQGPICSKTKFYRAFINKTRGYNIISYKNRRAKVLKLKKRGLNTINQGR